MLSAGDRHALKNACSQRAQCVQCAQCIWWFAKATLTLERSLTNLKFHETSLKSTYAIFSLKKKCQSWPKKAGFWKFLPSH